MADVRTMLEEVNEVASEICTQWEYDFMESITEQFEDRGTLTEKQQLTLEKIYRKACESPY